MKDGKRIVKLMIDASVGLLLMR